MLETWPETIRVRLALTFGRNGFGHREIMMRTGIALLVCSALCSVGLWAHEVAPAESQSPPFVLTIRARANPLKTGSEVVLDISTKNVSDHDINNSRYFTEAANYEFYIRNEGSDAVPEKESLARVKGIRFGRGMDSYILDTLRPGQISTESVIISDFYNVHLPGKYKIHALRKRKAGDGGIRSNTLTLIVVP